LAEKILHDHHDTVQEVTLIPSSGGVHEVTFGSELISSKKETGKHPDSDEVLRKIAS
jgi:predicted Rdx family selenoprotein